MEIEHAEAPVPLPAPAAQAVPQGAPGTATSFLLRIIQGVAAATSLTAMLAVGHFWIAPSFSCLAVAAAVQTVWAFALAVLDLDLMFLTKDAGAAGHWFLRCIKVGDTICGGTIFSAASAAAGVFAFLQYDTESCSSQAEDCAHVEAAIVRAFVSFAATLPSLHVGWLNLVGGCNEARLLLFFFNFGGIVLAATAIGIGRFKDCYLPDGSAGYCFSSTAFDFSFIALILQMSTSVIELIGQCLRKWFGGSEPDWPLTLLLLGLSKWLVSISTLGTACACLGVFHFFSFSLKSRFVTSTLVKFSAYGFNSLATGACAMVSACLSACMTLHRLRRRMQ